jgi:hypothetical protein
MVKQAIDRFAAYPTRFVFSLHPPASKRSHAAYDVPADECTAFNNKKLFMRHMFTADIGIKT